MTMMNFPQTIAGRIDELRWARRFIRERLASKPQPRPEPCPAGPNGCPAEIAIHLHSSKKSAGYARNPLRAVSATNAPARITCAGVGTRAVALLRRGTPKGDGRSIFPIRRGIALVPKELANLTKLRHHVRAFLILPLMVASAGQRLLLLRQDRVIYVHKEYNLI
jgi:hypothetical protein